MKLKTFSLYLGLASLLLVMLAIPIIDLIAHEEFVQFLENYFSPDGKITLEHFLFYQKIYLPLIYLGVLWVTFHKVEYKNIRIAIRLDKTSRANLHIKFSYILSALLILLWLFFKESRFLYGEGWGGGEVGLEWFTVCCLFFASGIIFTSNKINHLSKSTRIYLYLIGAFFLILGLEEISWGQTIFNWNTPDYLKEINYQNETNIHNLFNPLIYLIYALLCCTLGLLMVFTKKVETSLENTKFLKDVIILLPSVNFSVIGLVFLFLGFLNLMQIRLGEELTEQIFSVFSVAYAIEINKKNSAQPNKAF